MKLRSSLELLREAFNQSPLHQGGHFALPRPINDLKDGSVMTSMTAQVVKEVLARA